MDQFKHIFAELLVRAPGPVVQILPSDFPGLPIAASRIWERVRELQEAPLFALQDVVADVPLARAPIAAAGVAAAAAPNVAPAGVALSFAVPEVDARLQHIHARLGRFEHVEQQVANLQDMLPRILDRLDQALAVRLAVAPPAAAGVTAAVAHDVAPAGVAPSFEVAEFKARFEQIDARLESLEPVAQEIVRLQDVGTRIGKLEEAFGGGLERIERQLKEIGGRDGGGSDEGGPQEGWVDEKGQHF